MLFIFHYIRVTFDPVFRPCSDFIQVRCLSAGSIYYTVGRPARPLRLATLALSTKAEDQRWDRIWKIKIKSNITKLSIGPKAVLATGRTGGQVFLGMYSTPWILSL